MKLHLELQTSVRKLESPGLYHTAHHNRFTAIFPGPPRWAGARREYGLYRPREDQQRQTHRPSGWVPLHPANSATSTIPPLFRRLDALPAAQPTVSKHWRQSKHCYSTGCNLIQIRCLQTNHVHTIPTRDRQMDRPKACNSITLSYYEAEQLTKMTKKQLCEVHKFINGISKIHTLLWNKLSGQNFHKTGDDRVFHVMWLCLPCDLSGCPVSDPVCYWCGETCRQRALCQQRRAPCRASERHWRSS